MPPVLKETKSSVLSASHSQFEGKKKLHLSDAMQAADQLLYSKLFSLE